MKATRTTFFSTAALLFFLTLTPTVLAQPGGFPGSGRPMGPPPEGSRNSSTMSERERYRRQRQQMEAAEKAQQVRQKKTVREGDVFKVVGTLQDSVSGEAIPYVNLAVLSAEDTSMIKGGITDLNGYFELTNIPQGNMLIQECADTLHRHQQYGLGHLEIGTGGHNPDRGEGDSGTPPVCHGW